MLVFAALVALRRQWRGRARAILYTFAAGLLLATIGDLGFARMVLDGTYESGSLIDLAWPAGFLLMGLAAALQAGWRIDLAAEDDQVEPSYSSQIVPVAISAGLACWLVVRGVVGGWTSDPALLVIVLGAVSVATVRHGVAVVDSRMFSRALCAARDARLWRVLYQGASSKR